MNPNLTHIAFILDRSGSMRVLEDDTIGGFNSFIDAQKKAPGEAKITVVLFDDEYKILHDGIDIQDVPELTKKEYFARGMTALFDAIGKTINSVENSISNTLDESQRPSKVIVVITTDGAENSSREYKSAMIKELITKRTEKDKWEFLFLGADMDAITVAESMGICRSSASAYQGTKEGTITMMDTLSSTVYNYRSTGAVDKDWNKDLDKK